MSGPPNALKGEFEARAAGALHRFDTTLAPIAVLEERCGDAPVVDPAPFRFSRFRRAATAPRRAA